MDYNSKYKSSEIEEILDSVEGKQDKLVSGTNIKTINGESILGSGNLEIGGGGVYITPFTVEQFCNGHVALTEEQVAELLEAASQEKIIGMRTDEYGVGYIIANYNYSNSAGDEYWSLNLGVIYNGSYYNNSLNNSNENIFPYSRLAITNFVPSITHISVEDGYAFVEDDYSSIDNRVFYIQGECTELYIYLEPSDIGKTVRFFTGESCTLEFVNSVYWANGEVPTIEPYTHYELSLVANMEGVFNAVLTPFKSVE